MPADLMKITAALNAYPWTAGTLTRRDGGGTPRYCALGLLLRYAGVARDQLACAQHSSETWTRHRRLLQSEYGISDYATVCAIIVANDTASSHEQAIARVQQVLGDGLDAIAVLRTCAARRPPAGPAGGGEAALGEGGAGDEGDGCFAALA